MAHKRPAGQREPNRGRASLVEAVAGRVTEWVGSSTGFMSAVALVLVWAASGPMFGWSNTWQLVINTGTTVVTFLMVFLIQRTQNKDGLAIHLKLNEIVAAMHGASNRLIDVEDLSEEELHVLRTHYRLLVQLAREDRDVAASHSIEEAEQRHKAKRRT